MPVVFRTTRRIEFADTDMAGIVHFANFFRFMEAAECEFLRERGLSVAMEWEGETLGFPRLGRLRLPAPRPLRGRPRYRR
jgi:acyl-CoA thioesterase FadM